eukprot:509685-Hanusia_phi.AAC.3
MAGRGQEGEEGRGRRAVADSWSGTGVGGQQLPGGASSSPTRPPLGDEMQGEMLNQLMIKVPPGLLLFLGWLAFVQTNGELFSRFSTMVLLFLTAEYLHFVCPHLLFASSASSSRRSRNQGGGDQ